MRRLGRYAIGDHIASGGMASVHVGRLLGPAGFTRTVAIKRLHSHLARDPEFVFMFQDEARLAGKIRHPNVASVLDVVSEDGELFLVMDYVHGESLASLIRSARSANHVVPPGVAVAVIVAALDGLHAAHETRADDGHLLGIVHRDVSPQNILVGADGAVRVVDFGVAHAAGRLQTTREGQVKGKASYLAPEQVRGEKSDRRTDVYAASVVLWEVLAGRRLFTGETPIAVMTSVLESTIEAPSAIAGSPPELDAPIKRGVSRRPSARFETAREMAAALEAAFRPATTREVAAWVESIAGPALKERAARIADMEKQSTLATTRGAVSDNPSTQVAAVVGGSADPADARRTELAPEDPAGPPAAPGSTLSMATPAGVPSRRRRRTFEIAIALTIAAVGWAAWVGLARRDSASALSAPAPVQAPAPTDPAVNPPPSASAGAPSQSAAPVASALAAPPPAPAAQTTTRAAAGRGRPAKPAAPGATTACAPFTIDANGHRTPHPECVP
jgi:serine/threonine-protein kinase